MVPVEETKFDGGVGQYVHHISSTAGVAFKSELSIEFTKYGM